MSIFQELQDEANNLHGTGSQKATIISTALAGIREAFATLTKHGMHLHLEQGPPPPGDVAEWPKAYRRTWKDDQGDHTEYLVVANEEMAKNLTDGWEPNVAQEVGEDQHKQAAEANAKTSGQVLGMGSDGKPAMVDPDLSTDNPNTSGAELSEADAARIDAEQANVDRPGESH